MKSLQGYRICVLVDYDCADSFSENYSIYSDRQKWKNIKQDQVILKLPIYQHAPREYEQFKTWWNEELQHSHNEGVTLIVVDVKKRGGVEKVWKKLLTKIEEEEFDSGEELQVKFTTLDCLLETVTTGKLPLDEWGDTIERGARASVFYKDIMFVIPNNNDDTIDNEFVTQNGGLVLNDQLFESMRGDDDIAMSRLLYIVTDETVQLGSDARSYCNNNPLLVDFVKSNDWVFVNSIWAKACVDTNEKCDPEDYPLLFKPLEWSVQSSCFDKLVISVSGFSGIELQGIILWIEKLGGTYAESLSADSTHLIALYQNSDCKKALGMGTVHQVSIRWLYHVMKHGYEGGNDLSFDVPITITFRNEKGDELVVYATGCTPISDVLELYVNEEGASYTSQFRFLIGEIGILGDRITNYDPTLTELGLKDGDTISVEVNKDAIKVIMQDGSGNGMDLFVNKRTTRLSEMFQSYAEKRGVELSSCEFYFKDEMIKNLTHTPMTLGLCDGAAVIKVIPVDVGTLPITIRIRDRDTFIESTYKVKRKTRVEKIFQAYADYEDLSLSSLVFYLDGEKIDDYNATPITLKLEDDDQIDVINDCQRSSSPSVEKAKLGLNDDEDSDDKEDENLDDNDKKMLAAMEADEEDENTSCKSDEQTEDTEMADGDQQAAEAWTCPQCTLDNDPTVKKCKMCECKNPSWKRG